MTSKRTEDAHTELIKKLLIDSGLVCERSPPFSEASIEEEEETEEEGEYEEEEGEEQPSEAEINEIAEEGFAEELPDVFPTPSLRRVLPERIRRIEAFNRIKVLPETFNKEIDPDEIPKIKYTAPKVYIDILANMTGCHNYKSSLAEYWFLDTLANLLRRAQMDEFDKPTQAVLILWFCEWMKEMQQFDAAGRERMLRRWKDNMINAAKVVAESKYIPNPSEAGVYYKAYEKDYDASNVSDTGSSTKVQGKEERMVVAGENASYECCMRDLSKIVHYIYDLMGTDFQYNLVRSIFTFSPEYQLIDGPYQIERPKRLWAPGKPTKKEGKPKEKSGKGKMSKMVPDNEEYIHLMQWIAATTQELDKEEEQQKGEWLKRNSILPLNWATTPEFFEMYWPRPPTPPETVTAVTPPSAKKKGK